MSKGIKEGMVKKGGVNPKPSTPRPPKASGQRKPAVREDSPKK